MTKAEIEALAEELYAIGERRVEERASKWNEEHAAKKSRELPERVDEALDAARQARQIAIGAAVFVILAFTFSGRGE